MDVLIMQFIAIILLILMCPLAILAYKGFIAKNVSAKIRKVATVIESAVVFAVITVWFFTQQAIIIENDILMGGINSANNLSLDCLYTAVSVFLGVYWVSVVAAEFICRKSSIKPLSYILLSVCPAILLTGYALFVCFVQPYYFPLIIIGSVMTYIIILMHICNFTLPLDSTWQRVVSIVINWIVFLASAAIVYLVLSIGAGISSSFDIISLILIIVASFVFIAPSFVCTFGVTMSQLARSKARK